MPSSGLPIENLSVNATDNEEERKIYDRINSDAKYAMESGMFIEWLESFIGAWNKTANPYAASQAGITEWDM